MNMQDRHTRLFNQQAIDSNIERLVRESSIPQMNMQDRHTRLFNQQAIDSNIERLVRESPIPQILLRDPLNYASTSANSFVSSSSRLGYPMFASALPKVHAYPSASPCAQFAPFRSPQSLNSTCQSNVSYASAADIFKSLKNQSSLDPNQSSLDASRDHSYKENSSAIANHANGARCLSLENRQSLGYNTAHDSYLNQNTGNQFVNRKCIETSDVHGPVGKQRTYESMPSKSVDKTYNDACQQYVGHPVHPHGNLYSKNMHDNTRNKLYEESFQDAFLGGDTNDEGNPCLENLAVASLSMWIIKPVPGTRNICVEGKQSSSDENFWHSGVITRRISSKMVETNTGSIYRLAGNMEVLDAMAEGFSRKTVEAFWLGFPEDWERLINDHFNTVPFTSIEEEPSDSEYEITTLEDNGDDVDTEQHDLTVTDIVTEDEEEIPVTTSPARNIATETFTDGLQSPLDNEKGYYRRQASKKEVVLKNWIIQSLANGKGINVVGNKPESHLLWHSTAIEKRLAKRRLLSSSGSTYRLKGNMDKLLALDVGLPGEIVSKFSAGFPKEWQELIQEHVCTKKSKKKKSKKSRKTRSNTVSKKVKTGDSADKNVKHLIVSKKLLKDRQKKSEEKEFRMSRQRPGRRPKGDSTLMLPYERKKMVVTPNGEMVNLETLGRSRSGRLIKPPLQWWTGQTLELQGETITVKAPTVASSMFLQTFEDGFKKSTRQLKPYWNPRQKGKDYSFNTSRSSVSTSVRDGNSSINTVTESKDKPCKSVRDSRSSIDAGTKTATKHLKNDSCNAASKSIHVSKSIHGCNPSSDADLDPKLQQEVELILERAKASRTTVKKRMTCYSARTEDRKQTAESENPFNLDDTTDRDESIEAEQEDTAGRRTRSKVVTAKKTKSEPKKTFLNKVEQENVVSSSTGDVGNEAGDATKTVSETSVPSRVFRSRACKTNSRSNIYQTNKLYDEFAEVRNYSRRRKKALPVISQGECMDRSEDDEDYVPVKVPKQKSNVAAKHKVQKRNNTGRSGASKENDVSKWGEKSEDIDDHWTKEEKDRLREACKKVSPSNPHYWEKVAEAVRTKTAESCNAMFYVDEKLPRSAELKKKKVAKEKPKVTCLTAKVGTLKRTEQLRNLLEQQNENYLDDLFDSTPYRATRKRKVPVLGGDDDDAIFEELARKQGKSRFETPVAAETMYKRITVPFASSKKTPVSNITAEMLHVGDNMDGYVHKILKRRLLARKGHKKPAGTPIPQKLTPEEEISPQKKLLFDEYLTEKKDNTENHHDSDQEEDFYWDDDVNN